jgi:hypothetical protein
MSSQSPFTVYWAVILIFILSACAQSAIETESVPARTSTAPLPTPSAVFTPTSRLLSPTPSSTFTVVPTLPAEEAYDLLANWLQNNNECQLPCWAGLIPGKSLSLEAYSKLTAFSSIADFVDLIYPTGGLVPIAYPSGTLEIRIDVMVHSKADRRTIQVIAISTRTLHELEPGSSEYVYNAPAYNELLRAYTLSGILSKYGSPTDIWVRADIYNTGTQETFSITFLYPEKGIFVRYNMLAERIGDQIRGCPSRSFVDLWLLSPEDAGDYQEILLSKNVRWEGNWPYTTPIQEAASMSIESFYQLYNESTDMCLETPLSIWPEH